MSNSHTNTATFTKTHAEHLASKIASDLYQLQRFYGYPSDSQIKDYIEEVIILLLGGYLKSVDYGFKIGDRWVMAISYEVNENTGIIVDNNTGGIPIGINITGAQWGSYLRKSQKFDGLIQSEKEKIQALIPIKRNGANDPQNGNMGNFDKSYSAANVSINRKLITT